MKIYPAAFHVISIATASAIWASTSNAFTSSLSTPRALLFWGKGTSRFSVGENDVDGSGNNALGSELSFAAYQDSLKRSNGGTYAAPSTSEVYQDQYGRTIPRDARDLPTQIPAPTTTMDTSRKSRQPQREQTAEAANESTTVLVSNAAEHPQDVQESATGVRSVSMKQPPYDGRSHSNLVDHLVKFDTFPSQRVGHDRLQPVERAYSGDKSQSMETKTTQIDTSSSFPQTNTSPPIMSTAPSLADRASHRRAIEIMTLTDRMLAFPSQRVGHDKLEPARHGTTTPPSKVDLVSSSSSSRGEYVVADDPSNLCSPFRFLSCPDPNFVIDEKRVRDGREQQNGIADSPNASKSVAPDKLL